MHATTDSAKIMLMQSCDNSNMLHSPEADLPSIVLITCHQIRVVQETVVIEKSFRCSLVVSRAGQLNVARPAERHWCLQHTCTSILMHAIRFALWPRQPVFTHILVDGLATATQILLVYKLIACACHTRWQSKYTEISSKTACLP